ncbi:MAG TPA: hypothetical protein VJ246_03870 [Patescibacteria group bacterium]|nr:hypothetical protein [Patescibacteria group bacterium]
MPKQPIEGQTRSLADVQALVDSTHPVDEVLPQVIHEGKRLLRQTAESVGRVNLDDAFVRKLLPDMIKGTSFAGAYVEIRGAEALQMVDAYENMYVVMGNYDRDGAYNVWFERSNGQWKIVAVKVPKGGNLRA